jgi:hypothetical protein
MTKKYSTKFAHTRERRKILMKMRAAGLMAKRDRLTNKIKKPPIAVVKTVGKSSINLGRVYLPGSWIGHDVIVRLVKDK